MRKLFLVLLMFLYVSGVIFSQEYKADSTKTKSSIKVMYPSEGKVIIVSTTSLILWERKGIQENKARIVLLKSTGEKVLVIANAANNTGKYGWTVPHSILEGSYRIRVKAGIIANQSGIFTIKPPTFTVYEPHLNETLTVGTVKKIKWHSQNATGTIAYIILVKMKIDGSPCGSNTIQTIIPGDKNEYGWVVGKWLNGTENLWPTDKDLSGMKFKIGVGLKVPPKYNVMSFGPEFYIKRKGTRGFE